MDSMLGTTPSSTKDRKEDKDMNTEQVDVSFSQRPAIDKDRLKKLLRIYLKNIITKLEWVRLSMK